MDGENTSPSLLQQRLAAALQRRRRESKLRILRASPPGSVDFSSNDFLSLSTSPSLRELFHGELKRCTPQLGSTGSRLLDGHSNYSEALEHDIASFHGAAACLIANSGFDANVGIFSCLPQPGDVILYDGLIHASVHDGMRLSRAGSIVPFAHNSIADLRAKLQACVSDDEAGRKRSKSVFIAVESVYSMEGDLAPLSEMLELINEMCLNDIAHLIVDEAHATGVYGPKGRGRVSELGLEDRIYLRLNTFGKALACNGGK